MNNMKKWVRGALSVGVAAGLVLLLTQQLAPDEPADVRSQAILVAGQSAPVARTGASQSEASRVPSLPDRQDQWFANPPAGNTPAAVSPLSTMTPPRFVADSRGKLVLNGDTHANLEKLLIDENPEAMRATLEKITNNLPPQAAADLKVLVNQFQQYSKALSHSISPEHVPQNEREGLELLDSMHTLRVSYLGAETTQAMFGADEATTRQLIALMAADKDPNRTQQEKAERAQDLITIKR